MTDTNILAPTDEETMTDKPTIEDSLLLCASDLQHSAIYDNHSEMQSCIRAVADRITALVSVIDGVEIKDTPMNTTPHTAAASVAANNCTILPDGSAFAVASFPLPKDHWLYAPREYDVDAENPKELPSPILTHALRAEVVSAIRYAIRGATMCGKETDFDPDALVQNAVYALCGPYGSAALVAPAQPLADEQIEALPVWSHFVGLWPESRKEIVRAIEAAHDIAAQQGDKT